MKVQCSCGTKYEFELLPEMRERPVTFVCPACGMDASEFVDGLVRQEFGQTRKPAGDPITVMLPADAVPAAGVLLESPPIPTARSSVRIHTTRTVSQPPVSPPGAEAPHCSKHPGQVVTEKCFVCRKPICPKCMELFGYVCSPLCKAKAASHGIQIPVFEGQKSFVEARQWRKLVWWSTSAVGLMAILVVFWGWYTWFGCAPRPIFSVRFDQPAFSGQSAIGGKKHDQLVFLHGGTLARFDLKTGKQFWSSQIIDRQQIHIAVERAMMATKVFIDKANNEGSEHVPKMPSPDKMAEQMERDAAAALTLHVRGEGIWVALPQKLARYDWETGKSLKEVSMPAGFGDLVHRGDELLVVDTESGKPEVTHVDLLSGETKREEIEAADSSSREEFAAGGGGHSPRAAISPSRPANQPLAGLPTNPSATDAGKPMDPVKVAEQAQRMSLPEKMALPATLAINLNQQRALNEMNDQARPAVQPPGLLPTDSSFSLIPAKEGFVEFSVKLLESRIVSRSAMKGPAAKSALEGNLSAGNSMDAANEMLNEVQRSNGGDTVQEDHSRYQVTLRRPRSDESWTGEVIGPPKLYPLDTVNVLASDKQILVFDKANKKLWQSTLNYNVPADLGALDEESATYGQGPCVERKGSLYVFDAGVLSAFDLATGDARWRLPTVGVAGLFFDNRDMLYVNSTTASHDSLKYSRQIDVSRKVVSVVLKLDSRNGKILWSDDSMGLVNYVSGNIILTAQSYQPAETDGPETGFEKGPWLRIRRLNSRNGREVWDHYQERAPWDIAFDRNTIRLVFKKEVQVLKFPTF